MSVSLSVGGSNILHLITGTLIFARDFKFDLYFMAHATMLGNSVVILWCNKCK